MGDQLGDTQRTPPRRSTTTYCHNNGYHRTFWTGDGRNPIFPRVPARSPQPVNPDAPAFILIPAFNEGHAIGALIDCMTLGGIPGR